MKDDKMKIEQRIQNMKNFYIKASDLIDKLPDSIPEKTRAILKDKILGDAELKNLMEGIDSHRPPRIFLIGRTGVGKSSLINALCGAYVAKVSDTRSCTSDVQKYQCKDGDRVLMEILDTRGIVESDDSLNDGISAEDMLIEQVNEFSPDVAVLLLNCTHRDGVDKDVNFLNELSKSYADLNNIRLPIVVVVNKSDEMQPSRYKNPSEYPQKKITKINEVVQWYINKDVIDYDHSKEFILPDDFDESSSRIIAMIAYYNYKDLYNGNLSMHYYMRNGSGTCPVHGGDCSIWSNKMGKGIVKNYPGENSNKILCDKTIYNYAYDLDNAFNGYNKDLIYFFNITKDNDLYSSKFENGHSTNSTGTLYYH